MIRICIDAMGGDHAPEAIVQGCLNALHDDKNLALTLFGKEEAIAPLLQKTEVDQERICIVDCADVIENNEHPVQAVRRKKDASVVKALRALAEGEGDGFVGAGSTGAVLAGATLIVKRIEGILRPALAPMLPTVTGTGVLLIDCGANVDCKPEWLAQFAVMGSVYMEKVRGTREPRVGILNNGAEEGKGNELVKHATPLIAQMPVRFTGNVEGRDITSGDVDVVVTDGFAGNVALKSIEGTAAMMTGMLKETLLSSFRSKMGALLIKPALSGFKKRMDYSEYGGAPLLGVNKPVVKAHGSSNAKAFYHAIRQCKQMVEGGVVPTIEAELAAVMKAEAK